MEPWQSWAAAICIGGAAFWYYAKDSRYFMKSREGRSTSFSDQVTSPGPKRRNEKAASRRKETSSKPTGAPATYAQVASGSTSPNTPNASKKRKAGRNTPTQNPSATSIAKPENPNTERDTDSDGANDDKAWAKELDASRRGVTIGASKSANRQQLRSNHQSEAASLLPEPNGDIYTHTSGDVHDMLEPTPQAPSVLRVTGNQEQKKKQIPKAEVPQETKKQRQNRRKAEEKKLQREDEERQRQALLENQRRSARQARGEPAKDGLSTASKPTKSVWTVAVTAGGQPNGSTPATAPVMTSNETPLLDTFEHDGVSTASSNDINTDATTPATAASTIDQDIPTEEAQFEMLNKLSENSGWSEVPSKGKKNKKRQQQQQQATSSPTSLSTTTSNSKDTNPFSAISANDAPDLAVEHIEPASASKPGITPNGIPSLEKATTYATKTNGHPEDSDWAVF